jgi:DNA repair protein RecN (Recombination protein N)
VAQDHPVWGYLDAHGLAGEPSEDLVLRRQVSADGRSRAFVNDQASSVGVLRDLGALLIEVHGQHETVGLLDARTHRPLLDAFVGRNAPLKAVADAWSAMQAAQARADALRARVRRSAEDQDEAALRLAELDRLDPREGEETVLAEERALLGASEKAIADIETARAALGGDSVGRLASAGRALERARDRAVQAGAGPDNLSVVRLTLAAEGVERALIETTEAQAAVDAAADAFDFEPDALEKAEERLFALRAAARKLGVPVDELPAARIRFAEALRGAETLEAEVAEAEKAAESARAAYEDRTGALTKARRAAGDQLAAAVANELGPLKLDKARFRVVVEPLPFERAGPSGLDRVAYEIATNPGAPFGDLGAIASGGELARFALALKAALAQRGGDTLGATMVFDEVDQGVGGAVADAVGQRLKRLAALGQVLLVTHSPQVAARADTHWRVSKTAKGEGVATSIETLSPAAREEEIARMLAGAEVTEAARAAARALMHA